MLVIIDYGVGNLHSVKSALDFLGIENKVSRNEKEIKEADALILPGVGAFGDAMGALENTGLIPTIKEFFFFFSRALNCNLHIKLIHGENTHHIAESFFKGCARALDIATQIDPRLEGAIPSTKGVI